MSPACRPAIGNYKFPKVLLLMSSSDTGYLAVARRIPRKMNRAPAARLRMSDNVVLLRSRSPRTEDSQARHKHHTVPVVTNETPRTMKAANLLGLSVAMNCGINARKKRATFGFRTFVSNPCRNTARNPDEEKAVGMAVAAARVKNNRTPR